MRPTRYIDLKIWPVFFEPIFDGTKTFEIRKNDRQFCVGDTLHLQEWDPETERFTGRSCMCRVTYITDEFQLDGYVVLALRHA